MQSLTWVEARWEVAIAALLSSWQHVHLLYLKLYWEEEGVLSKVHLLQNVTCISVPFCFSVTEQKNKLLFWVVLGTVILPKRNAQLGTCGKSLARRWAAVVIGGELLPVCTPWLSFRGLFSTIVHVWSAGGSFDRCQKKEDVKSLVASSGGDQI